MESERPNPAALDPAWLDIPDPVRDAKIRSDPAPTIPASPSLTRGEVKVRKRVALALCLLWPLIVLLRAGLRPVDGQNSAFLVAQTLCWTTLLVVAVFAAVSKSRRWPVTPLKVSSIAAVALPMTFMVLGVAWLAPGAPESFGTVGPALQIRKCLTLGLTVGVPVLGIAMWSLRRGFASGAGWRGAALGAATGLTGATVLTLHCVSPLGGHIALAHGLPILMMAIAGAMLGSRLARA